MADNNGLMALDDHGLLQPLDHHDGNWEYLETLYTQPGVPVRINNANSRRPTAMLRDAAGWLPWHDADRRRFLRYRGRRIWRNSFNSIWRC